MNPGNFAPIGFPLSQAGDSGITIKDGPFIIGPFFVFKHSIRSSKTDRDGASYMQLPTRPDHVTICPVGVSR